MDVPGTNDCDEKQPLLFHLTTWLSPRYVSPLPPGHHRLKTIIAHQSRPSSASSKGTLLFCLRLALHSYAHTSGPQKPCTQFAQAHRYLCRAFVAPLRRPLQHRRNPQVPSPEQGLLHGHQRWRNRAYVHTCIQGTDAESAYQLIHDELTLDGAPLLNLASFVHTWMPPQADKLMIESMSKNLIDQDEYPMTREFAS